MYYRRGGENVYNPLVARDFKISSSNLHRKKIQSEMFLPSGKNQFGLAPYKA
jgi:hypothetical protein